MPGIEGHDVFIEANARTDFLNSEEIVTVFTSKLRCNLVCCGDICVDFSTTGTDYLDAMVLSKYKVRMFSDMGRFLAVLAVAAWSFGSLACPASAGTGTEHTHASGQTDNHGSSDNHHGPDVCCHKLTTVSGVIASTALSPSVKQVVLPIAFYLPAASTVDIEQRSAFLPAPTSTGPPRSRRLRFTTYSPLAPPFSRV